MSAFIEYKVRPNHKGLMDEELIFAQIQKEKDDIYMNVSVTNDSGRTTIIAVSMKDIREALELIEKGCG